MTAEYRALLQPQIRPRVTCESCDGHGEHWALGGLCYLCRGKGYVELKTLKEQWAYIFVEPPSWCLTPYACCFFWLRRAHSVGWLLERWKGESVRVHKPMGSGFHVVSDRCDCPKYPGCSHAYLIGRAGGVEMVYKVLTSFDFSKPSLLMQYAQGAE